MIDRHKINVFYTAPTAIRSLMRFGDEIPSKYDLSSLKILGTVGEPINPEGENQCYHILFLTIINQLDAHIFNLLLTYLIF